jgi:hypothetical protein
MTDFRHTCLLRIDMHPGYLDPEVATLPVEPAWAKEILANTHTSSPAVLRVKPQEVMVNQNILKEV